MPKNSDKELKSVKLDEKSRRTRPAKRAKERVKPRKVKEQERVTKEGSLSSVQPPPPQPKRGRGENSRFSRGFSLAEIKAAGLTFQTAKSLELRIDPRRTSCKEINIKLLKDWISKNRVSSLNSSTV
jgi:ribosomal protein L13E